MKKQPDIGRWKVAVALVIVIVSYFTAQTTGKYGWRLKKNNTREGNVQNFAFYIQNKV